MSQDSQNKCDQYVGQLRLSAPSTVVPAVASRVSSESIAVTSRRAVSTGRCHVDRWVALTRCSVGSLNRELQVDKNVKKQTN